MLYITSFNSIYCVDTIISSAAKAVLLTTLHVTGAWPDTVIKGTTEPNLKFNGKENVKMIELKGKFKVFESNQGLEVIIPFKVRIFTEI